MKSIPFIFFLIDGYNTLLFSLKWIPQFRFTLEESNAQRSTLRELYWWICQWKLLFELFENGTNILKFTISLSMCLSFRSCFAFIVGCLGFQSLPNIMWHIPGLNWTFSYYGFHCLSSGFLLHKSCMASKDKIAASNSSSSDTTILWGLWSALHLKLTLF